MEFLRNSILSPVIVPISLVPSLFSITTLCSENSVANIIVSKIETLSISLTNKKLDNNTINENEITPATNLVIILTLKFFFMKKNKINGININMPSGLTRNAKLVEIYER
jgi:hypothetical protein